MPLVQCCTELWRGVASAWIASFREYSLVGLIDMTSALDVPADNTPPFAPTTRQGEDIVQVVPVFQLVFSDLKQRIRNGEWLPGERLPSIIQLAKDLNISTGSVREALRSLQSIGLVKIEHGRGVFVVGARRSTELTNHFQDVSIGLIVALAETRRILEPELAALAAERGTAEDLAEIDQLARQMEEQAAQGTDFVAPDVEFHRRIAQAGYNPILYRMMESVRDLFEESRRITLMEPGMTARAVRYHVLIAGALSDRNAPQARLLMLAHMNDILSSLTALQSKVRD